LQSSHAPFFAESGEKWQDERKLHRQIVWQKCVSPDVLGLTHFLFFRKKGDILETGDQYLGTERVSKLMRQYAIPCIISLLVGALYNIVDQIFIANASYLGSYGNAANTVVFPLTVVASVTPCSKKCAIIFLKTSLFHLVFAAKTVVYV